MDWMLDAPVAEAVAAQPPVGDLRALSRELGALSKALRVAEAQRQALAGGVLTPSARNLAHYLALRQHDLRPLQARLAALGLSSLGRAETDVLASIERVRSVLQALAGAAPPVELPEPTADSATWLGARSAALFGPAPAGRHARIMVTLPSAAAVDTALVQSLVKAGMNVARINCAHDDAEAWVSMAAQVRAAAQAAGRPVRVMMDLAGPKIRTGGIEPGPAVLRLRPVRDELGRLAAPAALRLLAEPAPPADATPTLTVDAAWLAGLQRGARIRVKDARGRVRRLRVVQTAAGAARVECKRSVYLVNGSLLKADGGEHVVGGLAPRPGRLLVVRGQRLRLLREGIGREGSGRQSARIACTLPQALDRLRPGEAVWFDDGRIGGVVRRVLRDGVELEITEAGDGGERLAADKGINLPDTRLDLPALTDKDLQDLGTVARVADIVALSFAQSAADVRALAARLAAIGAPPLGVVLKIETRRGFENLPEMLFAAMDFAAAGVMIARGDLAVECGFERLAEVQEEILWACEAAHLPVIWATQVLETEARTGRPSRAEVTDAAMGVRADCVMLNKGPHIVQAMRSLDDILRRMQQHQAKKRSLLRALKSWSRPPGRDAARA
jgi:pyruvate kinase